MKKKAKRVCVESVNDNGLLWQRRIIIRGTRNKMQCPVIKLETMIGTTQIVTAWMCFCTLVYTASDTVQALTWNETLADQTKLETCVGDTVSFRWGVHLADGESVDVFKFHRKLDKEGHHEDEANTEILTTDARFTFGPGYQLHITKAVVQDSGNYTLKVNVTQRGGGEARFYRNRVSLIVKASPVTNNEGLKAQLLPQEVMVTDGPQPGWHLKLSCGIISHLGHPPVTVLWTTPAGRLLPSTSYENGEFNLVVPNPVESGLYTCYIDRRSPALGCVDPNSVLRRQATVLLDTQTARILMLEAELQHRVDQILDLQKELEAKLLANVNLTVSIARKHSCQRGFQFGAGKCYLFTGFGGLDWETSKNACLALGAKLAEIMNPAEMEHLGFMLRVIGPDTVWIGGKRFKKGEEAFLWDSTQQVITFTHWGSGEPNNRGGSEDCIEIHKLRGEWNDRRCDVRLMSACERMPGV